MATPDATLTDEQWEESARNPMSGKELPKPHVRRASGAAPAKSCGAQKKRGGGLCTQPAMANGKCRFHGGKSEGRPITHGKRSRYAVIQNANRLSELREHFEQDDDPEDLLPEVFQLRALVADFIERYGPITDALIAWHSSFGPAYSQACQDWRNDYTDFLASYLERYPEAQTDDELPALPMPPSPTDFQRKPMQVIDILSVGKYITAIGNLVGKIQAAKDQKGIPLVDVHRIIKTHGLEMAHVIASVVEDESLQYKILAAVGDRWEELRIPDILASGNARKEATED
jgi:hypothetical protein